ncbi:hypothetical protein Bpfe_012588, partial [Biomphalaria pfeifferi]
IVTEADRLKLRLTDCNNGFECSIAIKIVTLQPKPDASSRTQRRVQNRTIVRRALRECPKQKVNRASFKAFNY